MTEKKGKATGQGYNFHGKRAEMMQARLEFIKKHGGTFLFENRRPKGYPKPYRAPVEE
jgi:hypothetical protein